MVHLAPSQKVSHNKLTGVAKCHRSQPITTQAEGRATIRRNKTQRKLELWLLSSWWITSAGEDVNGMKTHRTQCVIKKPFPLIRHWRAGDQTANVTPSAGHTVCCGAALAICRLSLHGSTWCNPLWISKLILIGDRWAGQLPQHHSLSHIERDMQRETNMQTEQWPGITRWHRLLDSCCRCCFHSSSSP